MNIVIIFLFGLAVGSFLSLLADRLPKNEAIFLSRSVCNHCKKVLDWYDLIPLFSYIKLGGKCRHCHSPIPLRFFLTELATGVLFVGTYLYAVFSGLSLPFFLLYLVIFSCLLVIFITDIESGIIPDQILVVLFIAFLVRALFDPAEILELFLAGFIIFLFFFTIFFVTRGRGIGFGDVKLAFLIGFFLGFPKTLLALYIAFLTGALVSFMLILLGKKKLRGDTIPFGPFLILGVFTTIFFGERILQFLKV